MRSLQCYDMAAGRWDTSCAPMAEARSSHGMAALHGEVWAVGGKGTDELGLTSVEAAPLLVWRHVRGGPELGRLGGVS